jgi:hypothetical protein
MAQVNFGIIDDGFPVTMKSKLEFSDIQRLTGVDEWGSEIDLRELNMQLVAKSVQFKGRINVNGFYNPEFFFSNQNNQWDFLSFDWEYKMHQTEKDSEQYLLEILNATSAKVFVFTGWEKRIHVSSIIESGEFKRFTEMGRLEMLEKNEDDNVTEMLNNVTNLIDKGEEIQIGDLTILIKPSRHIVDSDDFWMLRSLIGSDNILSFLKEMNSTVIDEDSILNMFEKSNFKFFIDKKNSILSASNNQLVASKLGELDELSMSDALSIFGIEKLEEAREKGFTIIK